MRHSDTRLPADVPNAGKSATIVIGQDQAQVHLAPTHCPVCLSKLRTKRTYRLADHGVRRYRYCPEGCYSDRAALIVEKAAMHEPV
jgi:hypothetical protein